MEPKIGETLLRKDASNGKRDAFHVPVVLVHSPDNLKGGETVVFTSPEEVKKVTTEPIYDAVVDPFLHSTRGQSFWVFVKPGSVTNLTHTWTSPTSPHLSAPIPGSVAPRVTPEEARILEIVREHKLTEGELEEAGMNECRGCYS